MAAHKIVSAVFLVLLGTNLATGLIDTETLLKFAVSQYNILSPQLNDTTFIHTGPPTSERWGTTPVDRWTVGFYPGTLWMLYKLTGDTKWSQLALRHSEAVKQRQFDTTTHDVGFVILATYGHALEFQDPESEAFKSVIVNASISLSSRFHELSGCIRSWENDPGHGGEPGEVKVIADNMMNLELLFLASNITNNPSYLVKALSHATQTMHQHMRPDGGSFHVVAYNETSGQVRRKYSWQGYGTDSTWARGHAWIIHGFSTTYRYTKIPAFLSTAEIAASYFIQNLEDDFVPYWDFGVQRHNATNYQPRDTSAAAIVASGLLELYHITSNRTYLAVAEGIINSLGSSKYRADGRPDYKIPAILVNGTVFYNENNTNTAIVYGDYYLLQAIDRYRTYVLEDEPTTTPGPTPEATSEHDGVYRLLPSLGLGFMAILILSWV